MNRGQGRKSIFHDDTYFSAFIETLQEVSQCPDANLCQGIRQVRLLGRWKYKLERNQAGAWTNHTGST